MERALKLFGVACAGLAATACASSRSIMVSTPTEYIGPKTRQGDSLLEQLRRYAPLAKKDVVFTVGDCQDKTGKYLDIETNRFSRAVTQACTDILTNLLVQAGFSVAERNPFNLGMIAKEYEMGHQFATLAPGDESPPRNVGLIQRGGPNGGLTGANFMLTGAITTYNASTDNGGGGLDVDAIGFSSKYSEAEVGTQLRIVNMSTSIVESSLLNRSVIKGNVTSFHVTRILGNVTNAIATLTGGETSTTIERPESNLNIASLEFGSAANEPIDYAVIDTLTANFARQIEANRDRFYNDSGLVQFNFELPLEPNARYSIPGD